VHPEKPCPFDTGDYVTFREVQGMTEINQITKPYRVTRLSKHSFKIGDTTGFSAYSHDGIVEEKKQPVHLCFESLKHCIDYPLPQNESGLLLSDYGKIGRPEQLHFAIQSVYEYRVRQSSFFLNKYQNIQYFCILKPS
jgi:ubiquitin-activating enzyme E1